ncbi:MAG TPA: RpiB/LacA/LacB family sugar-phosphate isomerase, partial [Firmicutes bacterium]|nr:RpiB/LacA/LacB family sugar-phosphate isomerase [Bacillota bacterium]
MKVVIGSDGSGFKLKEAIRTYLREQNYDLIGIGTIDAGSPVPFFAVASEAAGLIQTGKADRAILICGTGMGMSQVANKYKGIRAACVE